MAKMRFYNKDGEVICEKALGESLSSPTKESGMIYRFSISDSNGKEVFYGDTSPRVKKSRKPKVREFKITRDDTI